MARTNKDWRRTQTKSTECFGIPPTLESIEHNHPLLCPALVTLMNEYGDFFIHKDGTGSSVSCMVAIRLPKGYNKGTLQEIHKILRVGSIPEDSNTYLMNNQLGCRLLREMFTKYLLCTEKGKLFNPWYKALRISQSIKKPWVKTGLDAEINKAMWKEMKRINTEELIPLKKRNKAYKKHGSSCYERKKECKPTRLSEPTIQPMGAYCVSYFVRPE